MKKAAATAPSIQTKTAATEAMAAHAGKIHPVVIYPFRQSSDYSDLLELYQLVARLDAKRDTYARPITVMDRKTHYANEGNQVFVDFRKNTVARHSEIVDAWCVDTCQMWYCGLGTAFERGNPDDVYWLIPGDFNYGTAPGKDVLSHLHDLPEIILELEQDLCIGEIETDFNNSKIVGQSSAPLAGLARMPGRVQHGLRQCRPRRRNCPPSIARENPRCRKTGRG